nr:uncharacterized protein LOC123759168 [Procambarus clarkii]
MVMRSWLGIVWFLVFQLGPRELQAEYMYQLAVRNVCPAQANIAKEIGIKGQTTCSLACDADAACQGFAHSAQEGKCRIIYGSQTKFQAATIFGYNMFWQVTNTPSGFTRTGNKAYRLFATGMTFSNARLTCWSLMSNLALPVNNITRDAIASFSPSGYFWILGSDVVTEGTWMNPDTKQTLSPAEFVFLVDTSTTASEVDTE